LRCCSLTLGPLRFVLPLPRVGTYDHLDADAGFEDADIHPEPGLSTSMPGQTVRPRVCRVTMSAWVKEEGPTHRLLHWEAW
jgi:hypothetical protein